MQSTIPLKPSTNNQVLSLVTQGGELAKVRKVKSCPFKALRSPREGWPQDDLGRLGLSPWDGSWSRKAPELAWGRFDLRPCGPALGVGP